MCCQSPVCSVKRWQMHTAVQFGRRGLEQTASHASILLSSVAITQKVSFAMFLVLNRRQRKLVTGRHTLHWGDLTWHNFEISIAPTVQADSLQRPSWTPGLICLYHTLPSYDLIWLNVCIREEDWLKPQLGILLVPVSVLSPYSTLSVEMSEAVSCCRLRCYCMEMKVEQAAVLTCSAIPGRNPRSGSHSSLKFF